MKKNKKIKINKKAQELVSIEQSKNDTSQIINEYLSQQSIEEEIKKYLSEHPEIEKEAIKIVMQDLLNSLRQDLN